MKKALYIIEGPAGSGKTTLIKELSAMGFTVPAPLGTVERPRAYNFPDGGAGLSLAKDMLHLAEAIAYPGEHVIMDRGFLSQLVYGTIRAKSHSEFIRRVTRLPHMIRTMVDTVYHEYCYRAGITSGYSRASLPLYLGINLPPLHDLELRRKHYMDRHPEAEPGHYPFSAMAEYQLYQRAAGLMILHAPEDLMHVEIIQGSHDVPRLRTY